MEFKNQHIMKQPELGQKILSLRKQKGLTQEELVEQCNINVRTIQRIEAGDVSPRSYTIKAILDVLGVNFEEVFDKPYTPSKFDSILGINSEKLSSQLRTAFIAGIIYFIAGFLEIFVDYLAFKDNFVFDIIYILSKGISFVSLLFFYRGLIIVAGLYKNYLLQIGAFLIIIFSFIFALLDIFTLNVIEGFDGVIGFSKLITFGALSIVLGIAILRIKELGDLSKWTGILEIVTGISWLLIILALVGVVTQAIVEIFEIILIYKVMSNIKSK